MAAICIARFFSACAAVILGLTDLELFFAAATIAVASAVAFLLVRCGDEVLLLQQVFGQSTPETEKS